MQAIKSIIECPERHIEFAEYVKEKMAKRTEGGTP